MRVRVRPIVFAACVLFAAALSAGVLHAGAGQTANPDTWTIPPKAAEEPNPIQPSEAVIKKGAQIYSSKCKRCHGSKGKGDGPDGNPDHGPADLTDPDRAPKNPDGIMFYKIWNGRKDPKMPAFKSDLSKTDVWTVIQYVKTFRG